MKKKLFLTDIDGTLLKTGTPIHPAVIEAAHRFTERGGLFGLCTGRHTDAVKAIAAQLPINAPCILCGGALVYDFIKDEAVRYTPFSHDVVELIETVLREMPEVSVTVSTPQQLFNIRTNNMLLTRGVEGDRKAPLTSLSAVAERDLLKVLFTADDPQTLQELGRRYAEPTRYVYNAAGTHFYALTPMGCTKGVAAEAIRSLYGGKEECLLFTAGDAQSDIAMQSVSDLFFVPTSAPQYVQEHAHRLIPSPADGGLAEALAAAEAYC